MTFEQETKLLHEMVHSLNKLVYLRNIEGFDSIFYRLLYQPNIRIMRYY